MLVDIAAFRNLDQPGQPLAQELIGFDGGAEITGIYKLAQRVVLELMTERGSLVYAPTRGTYLLTELKEGVLSELDVMSAFSRARRQVIYNLRNEEVATDSDDERISDLQIAQLIISPETLTIKLKVTSKAGGSTTVEIPDMLFTYPGVDD